MQVNAETLQGKVRFLELYKASPTIGISLNEEYQLEAYKMLLDYIRAEGVEEQMREEFRMGRL